MATKQAKPTMSKVEQILAARQSHHGDFTHHAASAQALKQAFNDNLQHPLTPVQMEAADMILHKLARIAAGDPFHEDHWDDIAGYATLVSQRCAEERAAADSQ